MTRNENHDASRKRRRENCDNDAMLLWSDLSHDVLLLIMMQLNGVVDFVAFSGVCKSWRSLALSNRNRFMVSRPPMWIRISTENTDRISYCYMQFLDGSSFKTIIPHSAGRTCIGFTCGYLVLFGCKTNDFWLVNPITRHELYFPNAPLLKNDLPRSTRSILVYSPSTSGLVFVLLCTLTTRIWFSVVGTGSWNHVTSTFIFRDLHIFKGKIFTLVVGCCLCELRLGPEPKLTLLETKNSLDPRYSCMGLVTLDENLCVLGLDSGNPPKVVVQELDFEEMKWMQLEKKIGQYVFFVGDLTYGNPFKPEAESWADPRSQYERYASFNDTTDRSRKRGLLL